MKGANLFKMESVAPTGQNRHQSSLTINEPAVNAKKTIQVSEISRSPLK